MTKVTFFDVLQRAGDTGPICEPSDWDKRIIPGKVAEKIKEYGLSKTCAPDNPIPSDDGMADQFWKAGFELAVDVGVLCISSRRVVKFSEEELKDSLRELPSKIVWGVGRDQYVFKHRQIEDSEPPAAQLGPFGLNVDEDLFIPITQSSAQYRIIDSILPPCLNTVHGREIKTGTPMEVIGCRYTVELVAEAFRRAGRWPGIPISYTGITHYGVVGGMISKHSQPGPEHSRIGHAAIAELKTDDDFLTKVAMTLERGDLLQTIHHSIIGGYAGGPEGCAITKIAAHILLASLYQASLFQNSIYDFKYNGNCGRQALWANSVSSQAISRNSHMIFSDTNNPVSGPCTDMILYESGVNSINNVVDGASWSQGLRSGGGKYPNYSTGLESKFAAEVLKSPALCGMKRTDANEIVKILIPKYEGKLINPPIGKSFAECFDIKTIQPTKEWLDIYNLVWKEFEDLGITKR